MLPNGSAVEYHVRRERRLLRDLAHELEARDGDFLIERIGNVVRLDLRIDHRIGRLDVNAAARLRAQLARIDRHARCPLEHQLAGLVQDVEIHAARHHMQLNVGVREFGPALGERNRMRNRPAQETLRVSAYFMISLISSLPCDSSLILTLPFFSGHWQPSMK